MSEKRKFKKGKKKPPPQKKGKRTDWIHNDQLIEEAFCKLIIQKQRMPSYAEIARSLNGMDEKTVQRHLKEIKFEERFTAFRAGSMKVIANLYKQAATSKNDKMIRMWLELFEGLGEKKKIDLTTAGEKLSVNDLPPAIMNATVDELIAILKAADGGK